MDERGSNVREVRRFFLQAGLNRAKEYKHLSKKEQVTMLVYEGQYTQDELDFYKNEAGKNKINFLCVNDDADIVDYVNKKSTFSLSYEKRMTDLITDFTYYGHPDDMAIGYRTLFDGLERLDGSEFKKESFSKNANFDLVSCRSGLGILVENISQLTKGNIHVYNVRVQWGQSSMGTNPKYGINYYCAFNRHPDDRSKIVPIGSREITIRGKRK